MFVAILTGVLYPIEMGWQWGGGWLAAKGFSDFAVIHFKAGEAGEITVLINPFSGLSQIYREYKDFEWSFGRQKK